MNEQDKLDLLKYDEALLRSRCVVVEYHGREIEFFGDEKAAGAWIQHVYLMRPREAREQGILIKPLYSRGPKPGDRVVYRGGGTNDYLLKGSPPYDQAVEERVGILDYSYGRQSFGICFSASAFREHEHVSCSGGPIPCIQFASLVLIGLHRTTFWRWNKGYAGAGEGGNYEITVPNWLWNGVEDRS